MTKIIIEWCDACKSWFVRCPRCGNNTCNGGSGEDGKCPLCIKVYEFEDKLEESNLSLLIGELLGKTPEDEDTPEDEKEDE